MLNFNSSDSNKLSSSLSQRIKALEEAGIKDKFIRKKAPIYDSTSSLEVSPKNYDFPHQKNFEAVAISSKPSPTKIYQSPFNINIVGNSQSKSKNNNESIQVSLVSPHSSPSLVITPSLPFPPPPPPPTFTIPTKRRPLDGSYNSPFTLELAAKYNDMLRKQRAMSGSRGETFLDEPTNKSSDDYVTKSIEISIPIPTARADAAELRKQQNEHKKKHLSTSLCSASSTSMASNMSSSSSSSMTQLKPAHNNSETVYANNYELKAMSCFDVNFNSCKNFSASSLFTISNNNNNSNNNDEYKNNDLSDHSQLVSICAGK